MATGRPAQLDAKQLDALRTALLQGAIADTLGPNPAHDRVTVYLHGDRAPVRMVLLDMNGRQAATYATPSVSGGSITCDLSAQAPGAYVMQLSYADGTREHHRLVRQ